MNGKLFRILTACFTVAVMLLLSSCTYFDIFSVDSLIRAPKLTGDNANIQKAFESAVGQNVSLVNPLSGEFRSAYVLFDYNGDDIDEAIVFYSKNDTPEEVHMHLLEVYEGKWQSTCDVTGNGSEVYEIDFVNLDKDSKLEISVVWTLSDSKRNKTLSLYKPTSMSSSSTEKSLTQISSTQVTDYTIGDMDFDNQNEIFYTYFTFEEDSPVYSSVIARVDEVTLNLVPLSEVALSKNIEQLVSITTDVKDAVFSVYIDCLANDGRYFTEIVSFDYINKILLRPLSSDGTLIALQTFRYNQILSEDNNSDFMVEIPVQTEYVGSYREGDSSGEKIYVTSYYQFVEGKLICTDSYYINDALDFNIRVADFFDITYLQINEETNCFRFRLKECSEEDDLLFSVTLNQNEQDDGKFSFYITPLGERYAFSEKKLSGLIEEK